VARTNNRVVRNTAALLIAVFCLAALAANVGRGRQQDAQRRPDRGYNPNIKMGEFPPDFELPKLTFSTDENGTHVGVISEKETVRLSSFRGKKPVCLIMSSYT
jgi:hypothetical protein